MHVLAKLFAPEINQPRSMDASPRSSVTTMERDGFFYLLFFNFIFYKNIFLFLKFTGIYPGRPGGRPGPGCPAAGWQGLFCKNFAKIFAEKPLEDRSPGSGAAGPPGRPAAGWSAAPPLFKSWLPPPLTCITKIPEKRKEREGGREAKPCQIFKPATAGNQNSSTLYKQFIL